MRVITLNANGIRAAVRKGFYPWLARQSADVVGWRIDYQIVSEGLKGAARGVRIYKNKWFSDHAPLLVDYELG